MDDLLQQGITAYKAGKRDEARNIFINVVKQSPDSQSAWAWLYDVSNNDQERIHCLKQIMRINPENEKAKQQLALLTKQDFPFEPSQKVVSPIQEKKNSALPNVQNKRLANPIKSAATKNNTFFTFTNILIIGVLACICIALPVFGAMLNLTGASKAILVPISTPTNVPVVIDAMSLMGKSLGEIRLLYTVIDPLYDVPLIEPGRNYANIDYGEEYTDGKYDFTIFYDENFIVNQVDLTVLLYTSPDLQIIGPSYKLSEWRAVMQMLNLNITYPPDETAPKAYVWQNHNGYRVRINTISNADVILYAQVIKLK